MERSLLGEATRFAGGLHDVADGVLAWLQPNGDWGESNAAVVVGSGEALLVDTLWTPWLTRRMLNAVVAQVQAPISTVVNTHSDGDHTWGNQLVAHAQIVATRKAAHIIREESPTPLQRTRALAPVLGRVPPTRTFGAYMARMLAPYDFSAVRVTPPGREFAGSLELRVGGRDVRLHEVGPAHTPGDLIVHVPDAQAVIAGDVMFIGVHPVMWAGPASNWIAALDRILEHEPAVVVPGHGPTGTVAEVRELRDYLAWLEAAAVPRLGGGETPPAIATALARSDEFRAAPWSSWLGPERMVITVATIDRHRRGAAGTVGSRERVRLFSQVAAVARELDGGGRP
jgi:glyoxylase-like metal-dependent hydrolase (beta-lactamase superfamily II)